VAARTFLLSEDFDDLLTAMHQSGDNIINIQTKSTVHQAQLENK